MSRKFLAILLAALLLLTAETTGLAASTVTMKARINPLAVKIRVPRRVYNGRVFEIRARVLNIGDRSLRLARVSLILPRGMALVGTPMRQTLGRIPAGSLKVATWRVIPKSRGRKHVSVKATARSSKTSSIYTAGKTTAIRVRRRVSSLSVRTTVIQFLEAVSTRIRTLAFP